MQRKVTIAIDEASEGKRLLDLLATRFTYHSREKWHRLIAEGCLYVNDTPAQAEQLLRAGDCLRYDFGNRPEPDVDSDYRIIYQDDALLIVDKPGNLPCHPAGRYFKNTLWTLLKQREGVAQPRLINRLDRETSGLVVIGKTLEATRHLTRQFSEHSVEKQYLVLVEGVFPEQMEAIGWLTHDTSSVIRKKRCFMAEKPKEGISEACETHFSRLSQRNGISVVRAYPKTGCLHQIRATLCSLGFPIVGDKLYGVEETLFLRFIDDALTEADQQRLRMKRQALHAESLQVIHPATGERRIFHAPVPQDMAREGNLLD
jgi:RluA family pseudouridine synthase